ncbi:uncharacterized protein HD556DRAFT_869553 [Suillus plorans]|uniref:Chromo domain-containing protein n=1 Tax=Suillus plorans TaxID=116603 RepID=A0A9P7J3N9_9AGAM|nr:uncharacterized protein HD556DRAFT_869553 [Suillus plorans]KAG1801349.1 hypothetical protein HD556DRAFT_869553 [Suillus plorans]
MGRKKKVEREVYHVEVITKARVSEEGDWEYYVKVGYDSDADTWEPTDNVKQCERLLCSFWDHVGNDDDDDYAVGFEITAKDHWIEQEKEFFATQFSEEANRKSEKDTNKPPIKQTLEPKQVEKDTHRLKEPNIPFKRRSPVAKMLAPRGKKRNNTLISSDVCHLLFTIVLRSLGNSSQTPIHWTIAH